MHAHPMARTLERRGSYVAYVWRCWRALPLDGRGPALPLLAATITALAVTWMWGGLQQPGTFHDERAYIVQARLLAAGTWTAPSPPLPSFWEMPHLYVEPAIFAKYPPGFAPLLVPGIWLGIPGLMPVVLAALSAALLVVLVRRLSGPYAATAAWMLWTTAATTLDWHASYLSETATVPLYLGALLALHLWLERPRVVALVCLVACVGWLGITRPVTGIALAVPIAAVFLHRLRQRPSLPGWPAAVLVGVAICAIVPYWSWRTLGSPMRMPYSEYSQEYFPWDLPGFTRDTAPPRRQLPPDFVALGDAVRVNYDTHVPGRVPGYLWNRSVKLGEAAVGTWVGPVALLAPIGLVLLGPGIALFAAASVALQLAAYTTMPHPPAWTVYYLELFPVIAAGVAVAFVRVPTRWVRFAALAFAVVVLGNVREWPVRRNFKALPAARQRIAQDLIAGVADTRAVVFVRRDATLSPHFTLWDILGPPASMDIWIVRDRGTAENRALLALAGNRRAYVLDEMEMTLRAWNPNGTAESGIEEPPRSP